jgi:hypothetical protein
MAVIGEIETAVCGGLEGQSWPNLDIQNLRS